MLSKKEIKRSSVPIKCMEIIMKPLKKPKPIANNPSFPPS